MYFKLAVLLIASFSAFSSNYDQNPALSVVIPAAGNSWLIDKSINNRIVTGKGITGWTDPNMRIRTYFRTEGTGELKICLRARVNSGNSVILASLGNQKKEMTLKNVSFDTIFVGDFMIRESGYQWLELQGISKSGDVFAEVVELILTGPAATGRITYVKDDFHFGKRGPSVHLRYEIPSETTDIQYFYNEITIPEGNDVQGSYYMANGFADGYFGIQVNSPTERRILFSVWSPYKTDNPGEIPDEYKIILLKKGPDVITKEFGNEGSGGQSYKKFYWKTGSTYRFLLKGIPSVNNSTDYTAWFYAPENGKWLLIASFRRPKTNSYLKNLYSFLENFIPETGFISRKGSFSNQWIMGSSGKWIELTKARFTADATARKGSRLDYSGGSDSEGFFLRNCGFFNDTTPMDQLFTRIPSGKPPIVNFEDLE